MMMSSGFLDYEESLRLKKKPVNKNMGYYYKGHINAAHTSGNCNDKDSTCLRAYS